MSKLNVKLNVKKKKMSKIKCSKCQNLQVYDASNIKNIQHSQLVFLLSVKVSLIS